MNTIYKRLAFPVDATYASHGIKKTILQEQISILFEAQDEKSNSIQGVLLVAVTRKCSNKSIFSVRWC